jgi:hypothetical protein
MNTPDMRHTAETAAKLEVLRKAAEEQKEKGK